MEKNDRQMCKSREGLWRANGAMNPQAGYTGMRTDKVAAARWVGERDESIRKSGGAFLLRFGSAYHEHISGIGMD